MRATTSAQIRTATSLASSGSSATGRSSATSWVNGRSLTSAIEQPRKVTASASGRSPLPWQSGQGASSTKRRARSRIRSLLESASVCMMCLRALQKVP